MSSNSRKAKLDNFLFSLYLENEILADYEEGIRALFNECKKATEKKLIEHIVSKIKVLSERQVNFALKSMANKIIDYAGSDPTALVATSASFDPDSSQAVVQLIKPMLRDYSNVEIYNSVPQFLRKLTSYKKCILADEFSGTGKTIVQRVNVISKDSANRNHDLSIRVLLISCMSGAKSYIHEKGIVVDTEQELQAGLSSYFTGQQLADALSVMSDLESRLAKNFNGKPVPALGYGGAEALFSVKNWNAPNSNFPILWWPRNSADKKRKVIFIRSGP
ncbi:hypothetical protein [Methylobacterium sp. NEAU K]|uniref:phosphoribosyltransferase-like protein n=1 Tax=Methylobacterium sp. NEAU K TaxID=3064946 RepID=UPI00273285EE|nr:hypothetical protein [Methylobacterium sp. NEAU K]MDP4006704.1 hypothetical protein [Methylobacterium sp. NEAU K]